MYCKASATLAITSAWRITVMANLRVKTNWAANLPSRGQRRVANPLQSKEIGDWHAACVESTCGGHARDSLVRLVDVRCPLAVPASLHGRGGGGETGPARMPPR